MSKLYIHCRTRLEV